MKISFLIFCILITFILSFFTEYSIGVFLITIYQRIKSNRTNNNDHKG